MSRSQTGRTPREPDDLRAQYREQLDFLTASCDRFDSGHHAEAKRIALALRILLHERPPNARSLLGQLQPQLPLMRDTALPPPPHGSASFWSALTDVAVGPGAPAYFLPLLDAPGQRPRFTPFPAWWEAVVLSEAGGRTMSRSELVRTMADQDGGAHVDPALSAFYYDVSRRNAFGLMAVFTNGRERQDRPMEGLEHAAVRQIGHEVLKTLFSGYAKPQPTPNGYGRLRELAFGPLPPAAPGGP